MCLSPPPPPNPADRDPSLFTVQAKTEVSGNQQLPKQKHSTSNNNTRGSRGDGRQPGDHRWNVWSLAADETQVAVLGDVGPVGVVELHVVHQDVGVGAVGVVEGSAQEGPPIAVVDGGSFAWVRLVVRATPVDVHGQPQGRVPRQLHLLLGCPWNS